MSSISSDIEDLKIAGKKKVYFASDFHLGAPDWDNSFEREKKIIRWLESIEPDAKAIFLVGDIFDFWFEYKHTVPRGFIRFLGKIAALKDKGIPIYFFTGNHDMWMFDYFPRELNIPIIRKPISFLINDKKIFIGHGDGLGPGDSFYKFLKKIFASSFFQWLFRRAHPNLGMGIAKYWSKNSRLTNNKKDDEFKGNNEWLLTYSQEIEAQSHHDLYIFGHRHLPLDLEVAKNSRYINLGEWVNHYTYLEIDEKSATLKTFDT